MYRFASPTKNLIRRYTTTAFNNGSLNQVFIVSAVRTPIGCFNGALKKLTAAELGAIAAKGAIEKAGLKPEQIEEVYFGNVLQANQGQSPARQVVIKAGCPTTTEATTINKVCASGMKATILAAQNLAIGDRSIMIAGGMESMSNVPFYVPRNVTYGNQELSDGIIKDGLMDVYDQIHYDITISYITTTITITNLKKCGCPTTTEATTINKVCASGMKATILAAQNLAIGDRSIMIAGGMESMSNVPFYVPRNVTYGNQELSDGIIKDGLMDVYDQIHMATKIFSILGNCAENTAKKFGISREAQDQHAIESYRRAAEAWKNGVFKEEIVPVIISDRKKEIVVNEDEEYKNVKFEKIPELRPVFQKDGTVTAANSSTLNDGASALLLMTKEKVEELGVKPLARVVSYGDAATDPIDFTIAPSKALPVALKKAGLQISDISLFEFNEAFSVVSRANEQILGMDPNKTNIAGGAVALGHPIGSSGSRILVTLTHLLKPGQLGAAAICNGGGGASSIIIERL
ncbi:hypothetical protein Glove_692g9 [Diversispora epigaea]|uniref:acetyl-CoA C-acetyltransferase n=1 Tax=Diversispora epigaea TaxID=1348612 RepID=A0A397G4Q2_9GLOM|nr:hypothetical protein Glove_692g9 [Diversispora epigaea]